MIGRKMLIEMARKGQKLGAFGRRTDDTRGSSTSVARKGHLFVYSVDGKRFMIPLRYLNSKIFRELFRISEEEFGLKTDGPIKLPCDIAGMKQILSLLQCQIAGDLEITAALESITSARCNSLRSIFGNCQQQQIVYSF